MGAIASGGGRVLNDEVIELLRLPVEAIEEVARREAHEVERRERLYRGAQIPSAVAGRVIVLTDRDPADLGGMADEVIRVPRVSELLQPIVNVIPLQLLAYFVGLRRGCDVDQPRNLAKSVTVE